MSFDEKYKLLEAPQEYKDGYMFGYVRGAANERLKWERSARARKKTRLGIYLFAMSTGLAALVFMGITFYTEYFLRKGMLFVEPNLYICGGEFVSVILGFAALLYMFLEAVKGVSQ